MAIIATQATRDARKAIANEVIVNESTLEALNQQVRKLHDFYFPSSGVSSQRRTLTFVLFSFGHSLT